MFSVGKSALWRNVHPAGSIGDFVEVWRTTGARRWPYVALALSASLGVFSIMAQESWKGPPRKPEVTYINSWRADRGDAEIIRSNIANQKVQDQLRAEQAKRDAEVKKIYRTLGKVSGMDVDAIEKKAREDAAREQAEHKKAIGLKQQPQTQQGAPVGQR